MNSKDFAILLESRAGKASNVQVIRLKRIVVVILTLILLVQAAVSCVAAWMIWQTWQDRRAWTLERQELLALVQKERAKNTGDTEKSTVLQTPVIGNSTMQSVTDSESIGGSALAPSAAEKRGAGEKSREPGTSASTINQEEVREAQDITKSPGPEGNFGEDQASAENDASVPLEIDTDVVAVDKIQVWEENGYLASSFYVLNVNPGTLVNGYVSCWAVVGDKKLFPFVLNDPTFRIRNRKTMKAVATLEKYAHLADSEDLKLLIEAHVGDLLVLRKLYQAR